MTCTPKWSSKSTSTSRWSRLSSLKSQVSCWSERRTTHDASLTCRQKQTQWQRKSVPESTLCAGRLKRENATLKTITALSPIRLMTTWGLLIQRSWRWIGYWVKTESTGRHSQLQVIRNRLRRYKLWHPKCRVSQVTWPISSLAKKRRKYLVTTLITSW